MKFEKKFCAELIEHMRRGFSFESFASTIGVDVETLNLWARQFPEFRAAKNKGEAAALFWWESVGREAVFGGEKTLSDGRVIDYKNFNHAIWIFVMKTRFRWTEKQFDEALLRKFES